MRGLPLLLAALLSSCDASVCGNELLEEVSSPDGKHVAAVFERNCGATTPYIRVVSLRASEAAFDPDGDDDWVFTIHGQSDVKVVWVADDRITVSYSGTGDRPTRREKWHEIAISYE